MSKRRKESSYAKYVSARSSLPSSQTQSPNTPDGDTDSGLDGEEDHQEADAKVKSGPRPSDSNDRNRNTSDNGKHAENDTTEPATTRTSWWTPQMGIRHIIVTIPVALLLYLYYNTNIVASQSTPGPVIRITNGQLQGMQGLSRGGRLFHEYLGIPYAQPPVKNLRFEPPKPALNWPGVRLANSYGSQCTQIEFFTGKLLGQEDCLFLNVFTPATDTKSKLFPVMVFIHGGYFMSGSSNIYRPTYFMDRDIVLVTLNYRLASLGFLNTGDGLVRGNMGLKDQNMALRWVQANIQHFGGDPKRVTIFGPSAGAAAVHYHTLSPMSKGLFSKAISQSGVAIKVWSLVENPRDQARRLGKKLNCPTDDSTELVKCLKKLDANQIISSHREYLDVLLDPLAIFAPSVETVFDETTFLPAHPYSILVQGKENQVPWMTGLNSDEGLLFSSRVLKNRDLMGKLNQDIEGTWPTLLAYDQNANKDGITTQVKKFYFGEVKPDFTQHFQNYTNMLSDRLYFTATHEAILLQSRNTSVYTYYYTYPAKFSFSQILTITSTFPPILELAIMLAKRWFRENVLRQKLTNFGICHGDELIMLFDLGLLSRIRPGDPEYEMSEKMVKLWTDFATLPVEPITEVDKTLEIDGVHWNPTPPYPGQINYLNLDKVIRIIREPFTERVHFWKSVGLL